MSNGPELSFTLTPDQLDDVLRVGLWEVGMGEIATAIQTLGFDNLAVYSPNNSEQIRFNYTKREAA